MLSPPLHRNKMLSKSIVFCVIICSVALAQNDGSLPVTGQVVLGPNPINWFQTAVQSFQNFFNNPWNSWNATWETPFNIFRWPANQNNQSGFNTTTTVNATEVGNSTESSSRVRGHLAAKHLHKGLKNQHGHIKNNGHHEKIVRHNKHEKIHTAQKNHED